MRGLAYAEGRGPWCRWCEADAVAEYAGALGRPTSLERYSTGAGVGWDVDPEEARAAPRAALAACMSRLRTRPAPAAPAEQHRHDVVRVAVLARLEAAGEGALAALIRDEARACAGLLSGDEVRDAILWGLL